MIRRDLAPLESAFRLAGLPALCAGTQLEQSQALVEAFATATKRLIQLIESRSCLGQSVPHR